LNTRQF